MFNSMRIRTKLAVALLIPLMALLGLSSVAISASNGKATDAADRAGTIQQQVELATASLGPSGVINALQKERNAEAVSLLGLTNLLSTGGPTPADIRRNDDAAISQFKAAIAAKSPTVQAAYQPAVAALDRITAARAEADAYTGERTPTAAGTLSAKTFDAYSTVINAVFDANSRVALGIDDPDLRAGARFIDQLTRYNDTQTVLIRTLASSFLNPTPGGLTSDAPSFASVVALRTTSVRLQQELDQSSSPVYHDLAAKTFANADLAPATQVFDDALAGKPLTVASVLSGDVTKSITVIDAAAKTAADQLNADAARLTAVAQADQATAENDARLVTLITAVVLALAVGVTLLASRSITRPLHRLVGDAEEMASTRLPGTVKDILEAPLGEDVALPDLAEVDRSGGYEIAEVASALNTVQASAAELAVEQAVLRRNIADSFVNLGRRNQNLLSRQLESITAMEREESDPAQLEKLFALDHLATRMRRNAESLLLLAGLEPHRQWSAPVAIVDVLRGALGEVEDYERVIIENLDAATIGGSAAADLTHLVAELLENALNYSPPGRDVEIVGRASGSNGTGYTLSIIDNGIGMDDGDLATANVRLAGAEAFTVAPSRYLGHYVVGRQAARLDVAVALARTPGGGITATIELASVLADDERSSIAEAPAAPAIVPERVARTADTARPAPATTAVAAAEAADVAEVVGFAAPAGPPATLAEALGAPAADDTPVATTASGYKKRVRGANTPKTAVLSARGAQDAAPAAEDGAATTTRSALSGLQAGMQRGRDEHANANDNGQEQR